VVAFIDDEVPIVGHEVGYLALPHQALDGGNIDKASWPPLAASDDSNPIRIDLKECA
jgi:hypothetical protein